MYKGYFKFQINIIIFIILSVALIFSNLVWADGKIAGPADPFIKRFISRNGADKRKGENYDISEFFPVTEKLNNITSFLVEDYIKDLPTLKSKQPDLHFSSKPNFIIFPENGVKKLGEVMEMPYVLQWDEGSKKYVRKYTVTPGANYYVIYDNRRINNSMKRAKSPQCGGGYSEKWLYELQFGYNGNFAMFRQLNNDSMENFRVSYNTLFLRHVDHPDKEPAEEQYIALNFPMINVPVKNVFNKDGKLIHEEPIYFIQLRATATGAEPDVLGIPGPTNNMDDPDDGAWCLPTDGNTLDLCKKLSREWPIAIGKGFENYPRDRK